MTITYTGLRGNWKAGWIVSRLCQSLLGLIPVLNLCSVGNLPVQQLSCRVANSRLFGFSRLLMYWKGSIYKLMYKEMCVFCLLYGTFSLIYRFGLNETHKRFFEKIALHCEAFINLIPLSFVLGFYVAIVVTRWWNQFLNIPWPDRVMMYVTTMVEGDDVRGRLIRRQLMRYMSLASLIVFQATSVSVKKRFPTMEHLLEAGVITVEEIQLLDDVNTPHGKWWVVILWACNLVKQARKEGRITDDYLMKTILDEIQTYRGQLGMLYSYDWISVPLVYTQVTTLAVYTFFVGCIFGRQFLDPKQGYLGHELDLYVPVFTLLQFFFYMGWLKVAEQLINPFGEDDDDFNANWVLDRNLQVSLLTVDDLHGVFPSIDRDVYFGENPPDCLPYTKSSISTLKRPYMGSTANISVSNDGMKVVNPMETIHEGRAYDIQSNHNQSFQNIQSSVYVGSPASSPTKTRRFQNLLLNGIRSPFGNSKASLDGLKVGSVERDLKLNQPLNGVGLCSRQSYLEDWLSEHESVLGSKSPTVNDSTPPTPNTEPDSVFKMELEDETYNVTQKTANLPAQKTANLDLKVHLLGLGFLNRDLERVRQDTIAADRPRVVGPGGNPQPSVIASAPEVFCGLFRDSGGGNADSNNKDSQENKELSTRVEIENAACNGTTNRFTTKVISSDLDIPQIVVDIPPSKSRKRHLSNSSSKTSSSCSSLPSYEPPESNQATVTSITPLLSTSESQPNLAML